MEKDIHKTKVIFRYHTGEVTAFFPEIPGDMDPDNLMCYAHMGQHGTASTGYFKESRPATMDERKALYRELEDVGYNLMPVARLTKYHRAVRLAEINRPVAALKE